MATAIKKGRLNLAPCPFCGEQIRPEAFGIHLHFTCKAIRQPAAKE